MKTKRRRYTIGYIISSMHFPWAEYQLSGIMKRAKDLDVNLCVIPGGRLKSPEPEEIQQNFIYEALEYKNFDGIVIWGSGFEDFISHEEFVDYVGAFKSKPVIMLEHPVPGCPLITMDCYTPLKKVINHLIQTHHAEKIGFIRGPIGHVAELDRFNAYRDAMRENGIAVNDDWIVPPCETSYDDEIEIRRMEDWYLKYGTELDGMASFNDQRIFFLIDALERLGKRIPEDLLVCGHDDIRRSKYYKPEITTVRAPFVEMTKKAVDLVVDMIEGKEVPERTEFSGEVKIRESCGCYNRIISMKQFVRSREELLQFEKRAQKQLLINNLTTSLPILPDSNENRKNFVPTLQSSLKELSINKCHIYLFNQTVIDKRPLPPLTLYFDIEAEEGDPRFKKNIDPKDFLNILIERFSDRESVVIMPICIKQVQYGLLILGLDSLDGSIYKSLQVFLGAFFREFRLLEKVSSQSDILTTTNQTLKDSLEDLEKTKHMLVQSEKIIALNNLTSGIAHKINTPLGAALTTSTFLNEKFLNWKETSQVMEPGSDMRNITRDGLDIIERSLKNATELVTQFKTISSFQKVDKVRPFLVSKFFQEVTEFCESRWKDKVDITYTCPENLDLISMPCILTQAITQLVENSVVHTTDEGGSSRILLDAEKKRMGYA